MALLYCICESQDKATLVQYFCLVIDPVCYLSPLWPRKTGALVGF